METVKTRSRRNRKAGPIVNDSTDSTKKVDYTESPLTLTTKKRKKKAATASANNNKQAAIVTSAAEIPAAVQGILHDVEESAPVTKKAKKTVTIQEPEKDEDKSPQESKSKKSRKGRKKPHVQTPAKLNHIASHKTISATTSSASSSLSPHDSNNEDENNSTKKTKKAKRSRKAATAAKKQAEAALYYNLMNKSQTRISVSKSFHDAQNNQEEAVNTNDNDVPGVEQPPVFDLEALGEPNNEVLGLGEGEEHVIEACAPGLNETITKETNEKQQPVVEEVQQQPKRTGGARIVRPKETISVVKNIVDNNNELIDQHVEKKVVEIVQREAGPRIVKPVVEIKDDEANSKRKPNEQKDGNKQKKLKEKLESTKKKADSEGLTKKDQVPDFKAIHEKEANKLESIDEFQKRLQQRYTKLAEKQSTPLRNLANSPALEPNGKMSKTPKQAAFSTNFGNLPKPSFTKVIDLDKLKKPASQSTPNPDNKPILGALNSNIPVLINKQQPKDAKKVQTPKRPIIGANENDENAEDDTKTPIQSRYKLQKTPATLGKSQNKEYGQSKSASKVGKSGDMNCSIDKSNRKREEAPLPPQLATSSFIRRKSFDLNASLSRRLTYKPYIGKLKPIDLVLKPSSILTSNVTTTTKSHNITKILN